MKMFYEVLLEGDVICEILMRVTMTSTVYIYQFI